MLLISFIIIYYLVYRNPHIYCQNGNINDEDVATSNMTQISLNDLKLQSQKSDSDIKIIYKENSNEINIMSPKFKILSLIFIFDML